MPAENPYPRDCTYSALPLLLELEHQELKRTDPGWWRGHVKVLLLLSCQEVQGAYAKSLNSNMAPKQSYEKFELIHC